MTGELCLHGKLPKTSTSMITPHKHVMSNKLGVLPLIVEFYKWIANIFPYAGEVKKVLSGL